jgi:putative hydrolase of the HAD superfamily
VPGCLLIDLDGVVRLWDQSLVAEVERRHGLPAGAIHESAFGSGSRLSDAVTGRITDAEWRAHVAQQLEPWCGDEASVAVAEWAEPFGAVDADVLEVVRRARGDGWRVGLLTNATTRLVGDLERLGLIAEFDLVLNSAVLGLAKPDPELFREACRRMGVGSSDCVFVDDTAANVEAAGQAGLRAHLFTGARELAELLAD